MNEIKIHCKYDELVNPKDLKDYAKNPNKHGSDQIERLAEIYKYQGVRHPIIVDRERNCIAAGHGRKLAAIRAGLKSFPVVYQKFDSDEQFYAFVASDNAVALWADLDLGDVNEALLDFGPDFNVDMLGIKNFSISNDGIGLDEITEGMETFTSDGPITKNVVLVFDESEYAIFLEKTKLGFEEHGVSNFKDLYMALLG